MQRCPSCTEQGKSLCNQCGDVRYCSLECQKTDWPAHKLLCKSFRDFGTSSRPAPNMRRIILFAADGEKPVFKWLPVRRIDDEDDSGFCETVDHSSITPQDFFFRMHAFRYNQLLQVEQDVAISLCFDDSFLLKNTGTNRAVLSATKGRPGHDWRGTLFAFCGYMPRYGMDIIEVQDMDMARFSDLATYLATYMKDERIVSTLRGPKVECVKMFCDCERVVGSVFAQKVLVPRPHPVFTSGKVSQISERIGMPLIIEKYAVKNTTKCQEGYCNERVTSMLMETGLHGRVSSTDSLDDFGLAPLGWKGGDVPDVLIAHVDRKPCDVETIQAFGDFCLHYVRPQIQWLLDSSASSQSSIATLKDFVLQQVKPQNWRAYLVAWRSRDEKSAEELAVAVKLSCRLFDENMNPRSITELSKFLK